jgi:lysophospholipase L1-like esterase
MSIRLRAAWRTLLPTLALLLLGSQAVANTLTQNVSWTIDRAGTSTKYRLVAYGDSIYSGYNGSVFNAAKYAAPTVDAEYLSAKWGTDVESVRRAKSGAVASDIYNNKIVAERSYMQASSTRVVTFEMCGNDGLQARSNFKSQTGTCNYVGLDAAVTAARLMSRRRWTSSTPTAYAGIKAKIVSNLYYPWLQRGQSAERLHDASSGRTVNLQDTFLPRVARMNFAMCDPRPEKGLPVRDNFATVHGS